MKINSFHPAREEQLVTSKNSPQPIGMQFAIFSVICGSIQAFVLQLSLVCNPYHCPGLSALDSSGCLGELYSIRQSSGHNLVKYFVQ